jgi:hypothetical protein
MMKLAWPHSSDLSERRAAKYAITDIVLSVQRSSVQWREGAPSLG